MKYFPEDVDPALCTHVIYAFAKIGMGHVLKPYEWNDDKMFKRFEIVKQVNRVFNYLSKTARGETPRDVKSNVKLELIRLKCMHSLTACFAIFRSYCFSKNFQKFHRIFREF
jgi:cytochrome c556